MIGFVINEDGSGLQTSCQSSIDSAPSKMNSTYKLTYFDFMGVVEPIRYLFAYSGVTYENVQVNRNNTWTSVKKDVPFHKLPILDVDGRQLFDSLAIIRFLAHRFNLHPTDEFGQAHVDAIGQAIMDLGNMVRDYHLEEDTVRKSYLRKYLENDFFPTYLARLDNYVATNGGFFYGKQLSWVDFWFVGVLESVEGMWKAELLEGNYNHLYKLMQNVFNLPAIKNYIAKRPSYEY